MSSTRRHLLLDFFWQVISGPPCIKKIQDWKMREFFNGRVRQDALLNTFFILSFLFRRINEKTLEKNPAIKFGKFRMYMLAASFKGYYVNFYRLCKVV
jgi:hypothetical protein